MTQPVGLEVHAQVRVQRGTATHCACGGELTMVTGGRWGCVACGKVYE